MGCVHFAPWSKRSGWGATSVDKRLKYLLPFRAPNAILNCTPYNQCFFFVFFFCFLFFLHEKSSNENSRK